MENLATLPPEILLGIVNEKLRLFCDDRQALFYEPDVTPQLLERKLAQLSYQYALVSNQHKRL